MCRYVQAYGEQTHEFGDSSNRNAAARRGSGLHTYGRVRRHRDEHGSTGAVATLDNFARFGSELVLQSKMARRVVAIYIIVLHILVWATIHRLQSCVVSQGTLRMELDDEAEVDPQDRWR